MLVYNPCWLFDVGFQLSFGAVIAIVLFQPSLYRLVKSNNCFVRKTWGLLSVSLTAQLGTFPLVLYYFNRFPTHFLLTNIIVIPLVLLIVYTALAMLAVSYIPFLLNLSVHILVFLVKSLNTSVRWIEGLPYSAVNSVWIYNWEVAALYMLIFMTGCFLIYRRATYLNVVLTVLILISTGHMLCDKLYPTKAGITFYNIRKGPAVHCIGSNGSSWLVLPDSTVTAHTVRRSVSGYWYRLGLDDPEIIHSGDCRNSSIYFRDEFLVYGGKRIVIINRPEWNRYKTKNVLPVDYLYVCNGYNGSINRLLELFSASAVILDGNIPEWKRKKWINECTGLPINYTSLHGKSFVTYCGD